MRSNIPVPQFCVELGKKLATGRTDPVNAGRGYKGTIARTRNLLKQIDKLR